MLDIFNDDAFSVTSLTEAINNLKFVPGLLGAKGLFTQSSVATTTVSIEEKDGVLFLVSPTPRGGPGQTFEKPRRRLRVMSVPHFQIDDAVYAEEVQNVRPFGQETGLETVMAKVTERLQYASQSLEATLEYARVGAMKGIVRYADGSETDLFSEFGVSQIAEVDFNLDAASPAGGILRKQCAAVARLIAAEMNGVPFSGIYAICGDDFFDALISHVEVRNTYLNWQAAADLRSSYVGMPNNGLSFGTFEFGGIMWDNYRGQVGQQAFVDSTKCHIAPVAPSFFKTVVAPADYMETVNTLGQKLYTKQYPMPNDKGVSLESQMNAICYANRPRALIKGKLT